MNEFPFAITETISEDGVQGGVYAATCDERAAAAFPALAPGAEVALKILAPGSDPERQWEAVRERTAALAASPHPACVAYFGALRDGDGRICVVQERLRGETLRDALSREPLGMDASECLRVGAAVLDALAHAEALGMVHRDVKPENVFLCGDGAVKLIDFELAGVRGAGPGADAAEAAAADGETMDLSGAARKFRGSFDYMAPEFHPDRLPSPAFRGDSASDVFSFGAMFHEMLCGALPYARSGAAAAVAFFARWAGGGGGGAGAASPVRIDSVRTHAVRHARAFFAKALAAERADRFSSFSDARSAFGEMAVRTLRGASGVWRLSVCVGKGGFGAVYKAFPEGGGEPVALKYLTREGADERFLREARLMEKFSDDRLVRFVEVVPGASARPPVLAMELLPGMPGASLKERLAALPDGGGLPASSVLPAFARYAGALAKLHAAGVIHRDVKPANLYLPPPGGDRGPCLLDLGIALSDGSRTVGAIPGTPDYMAPELASTATRGDARSDLWALGVSLCEALSGSSPFPRLPRGAQAYAAWAARAAKMPAPDVSALDPAVGRVVAKLCAPDPSKRYASAAQAEKALLSLCGGAEAPAPGKTAAKRFFPVVAACCAVVAAALFAAALFAAPRSPVARPPDPAPQPERTPAIPAPPEAVEPPALVAPQLEPVPAPEPAPYEPEPPPEVVEPPDTAPEPEPAPLPEPQPEPVLPPEPIVAPPEPLPEPQAAPVPKSPAEAALAASAGRLRAEADRLIGQIATAENLAPHEKAVRQMEHSADVAVKRAIAAPGLAGSPAYESARKAILDAISDVRAAILARRDQLQRSR